MIAIHSIFESISGEVGFISQGSWCTIVRLQGCNLRCRWCDTKESQSIEAKYILSIDDVVARCKNSKVLLTGGEPLIQKETLELIDYLIEKKHFVQVETNGSISLPKGYLSDCGWVVDYKGPSSGMMDRMPSFEEFIDNWIEHRVIVKLVVDNSEEDLEFVFQVLSKMHGLFQFAISPLDAKGEKILDIVNFIRERDEKLLDELIFSIQMHKVVGLL
ncbi:7-carboxy-7-deazaguanine synthase [Thermodesulfobium acidiphilum]|uniref:7-carboxy-7-deazaguanine synthase n=1 Tax=Thermodesulfobium acidiphilum TaxID=1794699 RepID=A0A2R4W1X2_THEAF|nr:radical SAM protein [Thermodesulfobium acidiphilum]AWB10789.1 7-carboxy-7-deazaguanine synthase [Thermodesulfobium acidiphilum]